MNDNLTMLDIRYYILFIKILKTFYKILRDLEYIMKNKGYSSLYYFRGKLIYLDLISRFNI